MFDDLSVRDNLVLMRKEADLAPFRHYFARFPILERRLTQHAGTLSGGEKKILSFVRGLIEGSPVVLLDEPSEGVQWENILHMADIIAEHKAAGTAFIVVEQNLAFAERIADRYLIMDQGRTMLEGSRVDDRAQPCSRRICMCEAVRRRRSGRSDRTSQVSAELIRAAAQRRAIFARRCAECFFVAAAEMSEISKAAGQRDLRNAVGARSRSAK